MPGTIVTLFFIGVVAGWLYDSLVGASGPGLLYCMGYGVLGSISGGLVFLLAGLGAEFITGLLAAFLILVASDVLSREPAHE